MPLAIPELAAPLAPPPRHVHLEAYVYGADQRPMLAAGDLLVDVAPVTAAEYQRFLLALEGPQALDPEAGDTPLRSISHRHAQMYAAWAGKRPPTEAEWADAVHQLGARLELGWWEWTATPATPNGFVVRGGRWRDVEDSEPSPDHRSFEVEPARDVTFRCVQDVYRG